MFQRVCFSAFASFALCGVSSAETQPITLYGVIDTGISYVHVARDRVLAVPGVDASQFGMDSGVQSGSRWGLRGVESIGDGWSVSFVLEAGVNSLNGDREQGGRLFGRQSTIALNNPARLYLQMGRQTNLATNYFDEIDPFEESFGQANMGASFGSVNTVRYDNLVIAQTPVWRGLQLGLGYSFNTGQSALYSSSTGPVIAPASTYFGTNANMRALTAGVQFNHGPWDIAASYDRVFAAGQIPDPVSGSRPNQDQVTPTAWVIGLSYDFGVVRVSGAYGQTYDGAFIGNGPGNGLSGTGLDTETAGAGVGFIPGFDSQSALIGFVMPMGGIDDHLMISWQMQQPQGALGDNPYFATQNIIGAAYTYHLSKRTNFYFWGSYGDNFQMMKTARSSVVGAGIRHLF